MTKDRVYVQVTSEFDATGYMQPRTIRWKDGRVFPIETVRSFRPAGAHHECTNADCYSVVIQGRIRNLYFEKSTAQHSSRLGRWYVECAAEADTGR